MPIRYVSIAFVVDDGANEDFLMEIAFDFKITNRKLNSKWRGNRCSSFCTTLQLYTYVTLPEQTKKKIKEIITQFTIERIVRHLIVTY